MSFARDSAFILAAALILGSVSCSDNETAPRCLNTCTIIGSVTAAEDVPVQAGIAALSLGSQPTKVSTWTETDTQGNFELLLPPGSYLLGVSLERQAGYYSAGGVTGRSGADTIRLAEDNPFVQAHFVLGSLTISAQLPPRWAGNAVDLEVLSYRLRARAYVSAAGHIGSELVGVLPGKGPIRLIHHYSQQHIYLPGTFDPRMADSVEIVAGQATEYQVDLSVTGRLTGHVRATWATMGHNPPYVGLYDSLSARRAMVRAADNGDFEFDLLVESTYRLSVQGGATRRWVGGDDFDSATEFSLGPGVEMSIEVEGCGIRGQTVGVDMPTSDTRIELYDHLLTMLTAITTDEDGFFDFSNLSPGIYYLAATPRYSRETWVPQWYDRVDSAATATPIELSDGQSEHVVMLLEQGATISGEIRGLYGEPVPEASLGLGNPAGSESVETVGRTLADGRFQLRGLENGRYLLATRRSGSDSWTWYPATSDRDSATVISIADRQDVPGIIIQILQ